MLLTILLGVIILSVTPVSAQEMNQIAHVYRGESTWQSDILWTWNGKHLYRGDSQWHSDILYTWDGKHLYKGDSMWYSDTSILGMVSTYIGEIVHGVVIFYIHGMENTYSREIASGIAISSLLGMGSDYTMGIVSGIATSYLPYSVLFLQFF